MALHAGLGDLLPGLSVARGDVAGGEDALHGLFLSLADHAQGAGE